MKKTIVKSLLITAAIAVICLIVYAAVQLPAVFDDDKNLLKIVYSGTGSMGSYAKYTISDNTVLVECEEISRSHFPSVDIDFGWKFRPIRAGNCTVITEQWDCGDFSFAEIYDVAVDESLAISYSKRTAEKLNALSHYTGVGSVYDVSVSCDKDGETKIFSEEEITAFNSEIDRLYGLNADCEKPDLKGMTKIAVDYKYLNDYESHPVLYLCGGEIFYPYKRYETEYWAKFTPDNFCSLDGINELLDIKD
ncbi:MAG: hypothetical protein NC253_10035 [Ruminococcus sp.]|nr:hypothetical protein [Ruminococcus sp.]MCM1479159.1 hypothetical protein [Muribaculaceae bacterium]